MVLISIKTIAVAPHTICPLNLKAGTKWDRPLESLTSEVTSKLSFKKSETATTTTASTSLTCNWKLNLLGEMPKKG